MPIRYKIVKKTKRGYTSVFAKYSAKVTYKIGKFVTAPTHLRKEQYHLLVFDSLENAKKYARKINRKVMKIFRCEVLNRRPLRERRGIAFVQKTYFYLPLLEYDWPTGTEMWEQVKILKEE